MIFSVNAPNASLDFFFPRKGRKLGARLVADMEFWRRFVIASPQSSFQFLLGVLPKNPNGLYSDACTSFGMAGFVRFGLAEQQGQGVDGLF